MSILHIRRDYTMNVNTTFILYLLLSVIIGLYIFFRAIKNERVIRKEKSLSYNLTTFSDVELATLEDEDFHLSKLDTANISLKETKDLLPLILVSDGSIVEENLRYINKDYSWLISTLNRRKIEESQIEEAILDSSGRLQFKMKKD